MAQLDLPSALVLLDLEDATGETLSKNPQRFEKLLALAFLLELDLHGRIAHRSGGRIALKAGRPVDGFEFAESCVGAREEPLSDVFDRLIHEGLRELVQSKLVGVGALKVESRRRLVFFKEWRWTTDDATIEEGVRQHLRDVVADGGPPSERPDLLLMLLEAGDLLGAVWSTPPVAAVRARCRGLQRVAWLSELDPLVVAGIRLHDH